MTKASPPPPPRASRLALLSGLEETLPAAIDERQVDMPAPAERPSRLALVTPEELERSTDNLAKADKNVFVDMNFKVDHETRRDFKSIAAELEMSMKDLLEHCFDDFCRLRATTAVGELSPALKRRAERVRAAPRKRISRKK